MLRGTLEVDADALECSRALLEHSGDNTLYSALWCAPVTL